jgi:hypothetical protein
MDTSKVSQGEMIAAGGGVLLIISLFLDWFSASASFGTVTVGVSGNAFDVFSGMDIIMLIVGIAAVALAGAAAFDASGAVPVNAGWVLALLGVGTAGWALGWDLEFANAGVGAWLGLLAALAIAFGGFMAASQPSEVAASPGPATTTTTPPAGPTAPAGSAGPPTP